MLFIISAVGVLSALLIGLDGLMLGSGGELERIIAIACFALGAAGLVGVLAGGARTARTPTAERVEHGHILHVIAVAPILALSVGVFLATLIPAMYVMLPFFGVWSFASGARRAATVQARAPSAHRPLHVPAYR